MTAPTKPRAPATSRADSVWSVAVTALSIGIIAAGAVLILVAQHDLRSARAELTSTLFAEARAQHKSPRDPGVLAAVARQLPHDVRLVPSTTVTTTGRVEVLSRRLPRRRRGHVCLILPASVGGRIVACPKAATALTAGGRTVVPVRG